MASALFSSLEGLGSLGYLSSVPSTFISSLALFSSLQGLGSLGYLSSSALFSSLQGLGTLGYLSSAVTNLSSIISTPQLISSLQGLGTLGYISSVPSTFISSAALFSSLQGLGTLGYLSSSLIQGTGISLTKGNNSITIANTGVLSISQGEGISIIETSGAYTIAATGVAAGTIATLDLVSTFVGIELLQISSLQGLGTLGYLSSAVTNLSSIISTPQLTSSLQGLGSLGYLSSGIINVISTPQLFSSLIGLGTLGYLSSSALCSFSTSLANPLGNFNVMSTGRTTASTITLFDTLNSNAAADIYVRSTLLYFGGNVIGGAKVAPPQFFTF